LSVEIVITRSLSKVVASKTNKLIDVIIRKNAKQMGQFLVSFD